MGQLVHRHAQLGQSTEPEWNPLLDTVGEHVAADFMWMGELKFVPRGGRLQAYKHIDTRRYLHLDGRGYAYDYLGANTYRRVDKLDALVSVFAPLPTLGGVTREQLERSWRAIEEYCAIYIPRPRPTELTAERPGAIMTPAVDPYPAAQGFGMLGD